MTRDTLRKLVDDLDERDLPTAERLLRALRDTAAEDDDPVLRSLREAPLDDEPETEEERAAVAEARAEADRGELIPHDEAMRRLGIV